MAWPVSITLVAPSGPPDPVPVSTAPWRGADNGLYVIYALIDKLNPTDYTVVNVEAPEMVAALERGNIDAYAVWEPWVTRGLAAVKNTKGVEGPGRHPRPGRLNLHEPRLDQEEPRAGGGLHARARGGDGHHQQGPQALRKGRLDLPKNLNPLLVEQLMTKFTFDMELTSTTISMFRLAESKLKGQGKLAKPLDYNTFVYPDLMRKVPPTKVNYKP